MRIAVCLLLALAGCTADEPTADGPHIASAAPDPVAPGADLLVEGGGFGLDGHVAVDGRPLTVVAWSPSLIRARLAPDQRAGPSRLVVTTAGRPSAPYALQVEGDPVARPEPDRRFPPGNDGGVGGNGGAGGNGGNGGGAGDGGVDDAEVRDQDVPDVEPPDLGGRVLRAEFSSDPIGGEAVFIEADTETPNEMTLRITAPRAWGVAFHLAYDRNLLRLASASPANEPRAHTAEIAPGRVAAGQAIPGAGPHTFTLRFLLLGRGEGRIAFPARYRTRRDAGNRPLETRWIEGSVRILEVDAP